MTILFYPITYTLSVRLVDRVLIPESTHSGPSEVVRPVLVFLRKGLKDKARTQHESFSTCYYRGTVDSGIETLPFPLYVYWS